jgi:hypothetical protein
MLYKPVAPVLIHSTNAEAADSMLFVLTESGWYVDRIAPIGEDWIESYWYPTANSILREPKLAVRNTDAPGDK